MSAGFISCISAMVLSVDWREASTREGTSRQSTMVGLLGALRMNRLRPDSARATSLISHSRLRTGAIETSMTHTGVPLRRKVRSKRSSMTRVSETLRENTRVLTVPEIMI